MQTETSSNLRLILLLILALASAAMAMKYRLERNEMDEQLRQIDYALQETGPDLSGRSAAAEDGESGPGRVFKLLAMLEKKDADIRELKQRGGHPAVAPMTNRGPSLPRRAPRGGIERPIADRDMPSPSFAAVAVGLGEQAAFLDRVDTSSLSDEKLRAHVELQEGLIAMRDTFAQLQGNKQPLEDRKTKARLSAALRRLVLLLKIERDTIFHNTGRSFGYDEEGAQEFASFVTYVNEMTSERWVSGALRATD